MNILVLNGSPRHDGNTETHIEAFKRGAEDSGHTVEVISVGVCVSDRARSVNTVMKGKGEDAGSMTA